MFCPLCGHAIFEGQKFCPECGHSLRGITDPTQPVSVLDEADLPPETDASSEPGEAAASAAPADLPALGELPTQEIDVREEIPDPDWATPTGDLPVTPTPAADASADATTVLAAPDAEPEGFATTQIAVSDTPAGGLAAGTTTAEIDAPTGSTTDEVPALFDGSEDIHEFPPPREPFRVRLVFILAFFGAVAAVMSAAADVIDIRTSTPVDGIATGIRTIDTLGTNLVVAALCGASVMVVGGLLACFAFRWGAGLAGGAGLALVGWAGLVIGLAELRIASAESITRQTTDIAFTLKVTRDLGYWLVVAVAAIGLLVFVASLRAIGTGGQPALNPWIAALGAVAGVVLVAGPLLPEGNATFGNNFRSASRTLDLPTLYFAGRLAQLGLIVFCVVFGLLIVRAYGLGLAAGGVSVAVWLWVSSLIEMGNFPLGVAAGNFGSSDTTPHAVTTVGMVLTVLLLLVSAVLATVSNVRHRPRY